MNEFREFQKSQRLKKEQLESTLKCELKQLEQKQRQEVQDLKTIHQRMRTNLAHELTREREQRALDRLNKARLVDKDSEANSQRPRTKRKRSNKREEVSSDSVADANDADDENSVNEAKNQCVVENTATANKKQKKESSASSLNLPLHDIDNNDEEKDNVANDKVVAVVENKQHDDNCDRTNVDLTCLTSLPIESTQSTIPTCTQLDRTVTLRLASDPSLENDVIECAQKKNDDSSEIL